MQKSSLIFFTIVFLAACNSNVKTNFKNNILRPYYIDIENNIDNYESIPLSNLNKELEYIPLETNSENLLKRINQIEFSNNYIFISDFDRLIQFDREGNFIRQIGANGRGPGEYIHVSGFYLDEKEKKVYVKAWGINAILEFDFNGLYIRSFKISFDSSQFIKTDSNSFVFIIPNGSSIPDSEYRIIITDSIGTPKVKITNYNQFVKKPGLIATKIPVYFYQDTIRILESRVDTLNTFYNFKYVPYAIFNFGNTKMEADIAIPLQNPELDEFTERIKDKLWIWTISEDKEYLFLKFNLGLSDSSKYAIFDKYTSEIKFLAKNGLDDDLGIGIPFWPKYIYQDSIIVDYQDAFKVLNALHKRPLSSYNVSNYILKEIKKLNNVLDETSNPVLIILK